MANAGLSVKAEFTYSGIVLVLNRNNDKSGF
jgi:hypothetical protein